VGKQLSLRYDIPLKLDISHFTESRNSSSTPRKYELDDLGIHADIASVRELDMFFPKNRNLWIRIRRKIKKLKTKYQIIREPDFHYDTQVFNDLCSKVYLIGFWQSEKYFSEIAVDLRNEIQGRFPSNQVIQDLAHEIFNSQSISIHVRRTDYIGRPNFRVCELDYYYKAIDLICQKIEEPVFFIFSDDIDWCKSNLKLQQRHFFVDMNNPAWLDLMLMRDCKHHIIANSTFSWWGAWLCDFPQKTVISPLHWFANQQKNTQDLIPDTWLRI
jgi:Glycosyl transferase family 11